MIVIRIHSILNKSAILPACADFGHQSATIRPTSTILTERQEVCLGVLEGWVVHWFLRYVHFDEMKTILVIEEFMIWVQPASLINH